MLPEEFANRMADLLGDKFPEFEAEMEKEPIRALKINELYTDDSVSDNFDFPHTAIEYLSGAYIFEKEGVGNLPLHHAGAFYVQDPSAMSTVYAAREYVKPGMRVLDMCAAPGGKTVQLACLLSGEGVIVTNEINRDRARILRSNVERMGISNAVITNCDTSVFADNYPGYFDVILCDVPCSGEGMLRKYNEEVLANWSVDNVIMCAERQRYILENAYKALRPGGYVIYSTCTFSKEENEDNVEYLLSSHGDMEIVPTDRDLLCFTEDGIGIPEARRFYPHVSKGEGQFVCVLHKQGDCEKPEIRERRTSLKPLSKDDAKTAKEFLSQVGLSDDLNLAEMNGHVTIVPEDAICPDGCIVCGVVAGDVIKGRFEPHHQLFKVFGKHFKSRIELSSSSDDAAKYIRGETLQCNGANGWCSVLVDGCPVGGGKLVNGTLKNHYPKGLRTR